MPDSPRLVLVRHGETAWSRIGRHTGREDIPLDDDGEAQARCLVPALQHWDFSAVLVSPLQRARRTCELAGFADHATVDADLQEWDYGDVGGRTATEVQAEHPGWTIWRDGATGGETVAEVGARADAVLARIGNISGDVCLFAHGHLLRVLAARWIGLEPVGGEHLAFDPAAISVLGDDRGIARIIWRWNDTAHLAALKLTSQSASSSARTEPPK
jgi:broad specificity phosphatase PhoE